MSVKLFILGRPGSGKSTAYRHIKEYIEQQYQGWSTIRYNDYSNLQKMFQFEKLFGNGSKPKQFRTTEFDGFDVLDFSTLDTALKELQKQVRHRYYSEKEELIVIEFARQDYNKAFKQFRPDFLQNAYFLFIEADMETCMQRIEDRLTDRSTSDNHFVSKHILSTYYAKQQMPTNLKNAQGDSIDKWRVKVINSRGSLRNLEKKVDQFIDIIIEHESQTLESNRSWWNLSGRPSRVADVMHSAKRVLVKAR